MNLEEQAELLQKEALSIIEKLNFRNILSSYGEVKVVGSVALNLMTWRDIDIHVFTIKKPTKEDSIKVISEFYKKENIRKITCIDYDDYRLSKNITNKPTGQYVGIEYVNEQGQQWKIDLWLLVKSEVLNNEFEVNNINPENRKIILEIKNKFHSHPFYRNKITSVDIYKAVLSENIKTIDEFNIYLNNKGIISNEDK